METLVELTDLPESDPGAPCPVLFANEHRLLLAYYLSPRTREANGGLQSGVIVFERVFDFVFGGPNDEALGGHRLAKLGLRPYSFCEVSQSRWIGELSSRNRVHPHHSDAVYSNLRHFVLTFHDSTLEVAAHSLSACTDERAPIDCVRGSLERWDEWA